MRFSVLLLLAGCRQIFGLDEVNPADGDGPPPLPDVFIPDAGICQGVSSECLGPVLRECTMAGQDPTDTVCPWGCSATTGTAHCAELQPSGGALTPLDLSNTMALVDISIAVNGVTINTDDGSITGVRNPGVGIVNGIDFQPRGNVGVFRMRSLVFGAGALITIQGSHAFAVAAPEGITIDAVLDATNACEGSNPTPGGFIGGNSETKGNGPAPGGAGNGGNNDSSAGAGGGFGGVGGTAGSGTNHLGALGGGTTGDAEISLLQGGSGGGGGGGSPGARGGAGGGAVQLISNHPIQITSGGINVGGCGGLGSSNNQGAAGGGGAGGAILIEAPTFEIGAAAILAANGGGGGGSHSNSRGQHGTLSATPATGGIGSAFNGAGGAGAAGSDVDGDPGLNGDCGGGGGGAAGRIRINLLGPLPPPAGIMSPQPTAGPATVQ